MNSDLALRLKNNGSADLDKARRNATEARNAMAGEAVASVTPSRRAVKTFCAALALAAGAFVLTMLKDPPQSIAFNPGAGVQPLDIQVQTGIPTGDYGSSAN